MHTVEYHQSSSVRYLNKWYWWCKTKDRMSLSAPRVYYKTLRRAKQGHLNYCEHAQKFNSAHQPKESNG
jgi:hypothetical protein